MSLKLVWKGKEVHNKVLLASARAGNSILADCVVAAKQKVSVQTTQLQGSIQMREMQMTGARELRGQFGSWATNYALYVEKGTRPHFPPVDALMRNMHIDRNHAFAVARSISRKGTKAYPYLQPAADEYFPLLAARIKQEFANG